MKWLLAFSVIANVVLVFALASRPPRASEPPATASSSSVSSQGLLRPAADGAFGTNAPGVAIAKHKGTSASRANTIEVEDYPEFISRLRAAGLSEDTIATLIVAEIFFRGIEDTVALQWKLNTGELTQDDFDLQQRRLQAENEATLKVLLGKDGFRRFQLEHDFQLKQLIESGAVPREAVEKYFDLRKAQEERIKEWEDELRAKGLNPADYADKRAEFEKAYQEKMNGVLGADVAAQIRAETDWQMQRLRRQLAATPVSDEEYAQISELLRTLRQEQTRLSALQQRGELDHKDAATQRQAADQKYKEQLAALLGPERQAEYDKQNDWAYNQVTLFGRPNGLSREQMDFVYQRIKEHQKEQQELHKQLQAKQLTRADYDAALEQLNGAARRRLERYLSVERYERLRRAMGQVP